MNEKHTIWYRETIESEPLEQGEFPTYQAAIEAGQAKFPRATWWVESKHFRCARWEEFLSGYTIPSKRRRSTLREELGYV